MKEAENPIVEGVPQETFHDEPTFKEKIDNISAQYEMFLFMEQKGIPVKDENVDDTFVDKRMHQLREGFDRESSSKTKRELESEYISLVCEASQEEFNEWRLGTLDRLMCGLIREILEEKVKGERNSLEGERLFSIFELYMVAKDRRNGG